MSSGEDHYDVFHRDAIASLLQPNSGYFLNFVGYNFRKIAQLYKCDVTVNGRRILQAETCFRRDYKRTLDEMGAVHRSDSLDYFKLAGFLAYWLRRRVVIENITYATHPTLPDQTLVPYPIQETFTQYADELCAFILGYEICLRGECKDVSQIQPLPDREVYLRTVVPLLKEKNVSPHALYIIYVSLFEQRPVA